MMALGSCLRQEEDVSFLLKFGEIRTDIGGNVYRRLARTASEEVNRGPVVGRLDSGQMFDIERGGIFTERNV